MFTAEAILVLFHILVDDEGHGDVGCDSKFPDGDAGEGEPPAGRGGGPGKVPTGDGAHL